jgi:hypothetical protein
MTAEIDAKELRDVLARGEYIPTGDRKIIERAATLLESRASEVRALREQVAAEKQRADANQRACEELERQLTASRQQ